MADAPSFRSDFFSSHKSITQQAAWPTQCLNRFLSGQLRPPGRPDGKPRVADRAPLDRQRGVPPGEAVGVEGGGEARGVREAGEDAAARGRAKRRAHGAARPGCGEARPKLLGHVWRVIWMRNTVKRSRLSCLCTPSSRLCCRQEQHHYGRRFRPRRPLWEHRGE